MTNTKFEKILKILFLKLNNIDLSFDKKILMWRTYTINKALSTIKQVQIIDKKNFIIAALDANKKTFIMHIAIQKPEKILVYFKKQAYIRVLLYDKAPN